MTTARKDAGAAILVRGTSSGITGSGAVSLMDLSGYGRADLTFGAQGEDTWDGAVLYLPSNSTGLGYGDPVFYGGGTFGRAVDMRLGSTLTP